MGARIKVDEHGRTLCQHRSCKVVYESIDVAWSVAFRIFAQTGAIVTPYLCARSKCGVGRVRVTVTGNPWAFDPFRQFVGMRKRRIRGCGMWHLTSKTWFILASGRPFMRNHAGHVIGPERQCVRKDGTPKQMYACESSALAAIEKGNLANYAPYRC